MLVIIIVIGRTSHECVGDQIGQIGGMEREWSGLVGISVSVTHIQVQGRIDKGLVHVV